jgi:glucose/arabinose dehydrogenase
MRPVVLAAVVAVVALMAVGVVGVLAASGDLPWQTRAVEVARDGTGTDPTPGAAVTPTAAASLGGTGTPAGPPAAHFNVAFPKLPKLERPTNMIRLQDNWMLVSLQDGRIVTFPNDPGASSLITVVDLRSKVSRDGNEEGLLGMAIPPRASLGDLYLYYSAKPGDRRTVLSSFQFTGAGADLRADPGSELVLLTVPQPFSNHKGGELAFGPDGMLYLGLGDGGSEGDPNGNGQDLKKNLLGSIVRIDVRNASKEKPYSIPPDNPFASSPNGEKPETWAYGLRNPWRFSWDSATGAMIAGDVGQDKFEEIDIIEKGKNYGWNIMEASHCHKPANGCSEDGLTLPIFEYSHEGGACSITGGYVYHGSAVPAMQGWYVYADYCTGEISAIRADAAAGSNPKPVTLQSDGPQVASFAQDWLPQSAEPELYVLSFDGKIYRMGP